MKRDGFISVLTLMILCIISMFCISILYTSQIQTLLAFGSQKGTQAKIFGEDKINRLIYNENYRKKYIYPHLVKVCKNNYIQDKYIVLLDDEGFKESNKNRVEISFKNKNNRKYINIESSGRYNDIRNTTVFVGTIIKNIFESEQAYIQKSKLTENEAGELDDLLNLIKKDIREYNKDLVLDFTKVFTDSRILTINLLNNKEIIMDFNNTKLNTKHILVVLENKFLKDNQVIIGSDLLPNDDLIKLSGILYIEGDLIINQAFSFTGIIIIDDGDIIVNTDIDPHIEGIVIHKDGGQNIAEIIPVYNQEKIYYYGVHLPGFMDPKKEIIKKY